MVRLGATAMLPCAWAAASYDEAVASTNLYLSAGAYCGAPKFVPQFQQSWSCGPACSDAGSVTDITLFEDSDLGVFGFAGRFDGACLVAFRGTSTPAAKTTDTEYSLVDFNQSSCAGCQVFKGYYEGYQNVRPTILSALSALDCTDLRLTGHSMGAGIAVMATYDLGQSYNIVSNYNFGCPRTGNPAFAKSYNDLYSDVTHRVTHSKDPIPHGPEVSMGYEHVDGEVFYKGETSGGYKICSGGEDKTCADQYGGSVLADALLAACCSDDHLTYMQDAVTVSTDGDNCTHVATTLAAKHALISTAAYCEPETLKNWDCGAPCSDLGSAITNVEPLRAVFESRVASGVIRGFVGHWNNRCVLSLADPFTAEESLRVLKNSSAEDLEPWHDGDCFACCEGCKVFGPTKRMYEALKQPLLDALRKIGCTADAPATSGRRLMATGHGFGASVAALAAFDLMNGTGYYKGGFGIEPAFSFGSPRLGNRDFADTFKRILGHEIFRVTHHKDALLQYPRREHGYAHLEHELYFDAEASEDPTSYVRCTHDGENSACAMRHGQDPKYVGDIEDHVKYMQPMVSTNMDASACSQTLV